MATDLVKVEHISKAFSGIAALDDVRFDLRAGEVYALLGENGAALGRNTAVHAKRLGMPLCGNSENLAW